MTPGVVRVAEQDHVRQPGLGFEVEGGGSSVEGLGFRGLF